MYTLKSQLCAVAYTCVFHRPIATKTPIKQFSAQNKVNYT